MAWVILGFIPRAGNMLAAGPTQPPVQWVFAHFEITHLYL
jgi:hypothetical protein